MKSHFARYVGISSSKRMGMRKKIISLVVSCFLLAFLFSSQMPTSAYADVYNADIVSYAAQFLGTPYSTYDCSNFVYVVFQHFGINLTTHAASYYTNPTAYGTVFQSESEAKPGDIISWSGHVGIYVGPDQMINSMPNGGVKYHGISNFQDANHVDNPPHIFIRVYGVSYPEPIPTGSEMASGYGQVIPDGNYLIMNAASPANTFCYLDIGGAEVPAAPGTDVGLRGPITIEPPAHEIWTVQYNTDGFYSITQYGTDGEISLDIKGASVSAGANVQVFTNNNGSNQKWAISILNERGYRIQAKCSGWAITCSAVGTNSVVTQEVLSDTDNQCWVFIPYTPPQNIPEGRYVLKSTLNDSLELDVEGDTGTVTNGTNVRIWNDSVSSRYNSFDLVKLSNGYYKLIHHASGKCLSVDGGGTAFGKNVVINTDDGSLSQQWAIVPANERGGYFLFARCSGYALAVAGGYMDDGTNIYQSGINYYHPNKIWKLEQAEYRLEFDGNGGQSVLGVQTKYYKEPYIIPTEGATRPGFTLLGWATRHDANEPEFQSLFAVDADTVLYAVWDEDAYLILPDSISTIEEEAFSGLAIKEARLPASIQRIGARAFAECEKLRLVEIPVASVSIEDNAFYGADNVTILAPAGGTVQSFANRNGIPFRAMD